MSLLTIAQDVAADIGVDLPQTVINNDDDDARRLLRHINATCKLLMREHNWQALRRQATFTSVATESQGAISSIVPDNDVDRIIPSTLYNRSTQRQQFGQTQAADYAYDKARNFNTIYDQFYVRGGELLINPVPSAGNTMAFEYVSNRFAYAGSERKAGFTADSDETYLDEELVKLGTIARFKRSIGADWQGDELAFRQELAKRKAADVPQGMVQMAEASVDFDYGFFVERQL